MKFKTKKFTLTSRKALYGFSFTIPWIIGFVIFFLVPLISSFWFSFCNIEITTTGLKTTFVKLEHWKYILTEFDGYTDDLLESISSFIYSLPIIIFLSVCIAVILNQNFKGRTIARAVFFIPAIVASGVVMTAFNSNGAAMSSMSGGGSFFSGGIDFNEIISELGLPEQITGILTTYTSQISSLIWSCGVQIILVLSGLQSISPQLYEAAQIEGATPWESFWFVTFPMLSNILLVVVFYTTIDLFTNAENPVMDSAYYLILQKQNYSESSVMLWAYFIIVGVIFAALMYLMNKFMLKKWNN